MPPRVQKNRSGQDWTGLDASHSKGFGALRTCVKGSYAGLDGTNPGLICNACDLYIQRDLSRHKPPEKLAH